MEPAPEAAHPSAVEPSTGFTPKEACVTRPPDSHPAVGSSPRTPEPAESGWAPVMELTAADIFQYWPFGDMLNSLKSLSLLGDSWPNYVRLKGEEGDKEIRCPPTTHFIATVDDVSDMLDSTPMIPTVWTSLQETIQNQRGAGLPPRLTIYT